MRVEDVEHGDQPEGGYGGEYNGMGGNQPMYGTVGVEGEWTKTHMLGGDGVHDDQPEKSLLGGMVRPRTIVFNWEDRKIF